MTLLYNGYIFLKVIPQGNLILNKRHRISRLKNSTSSQTLFYNINFHVFFDYTPLKKPAFMSTDV
jgi:hypothetical protein